MLNMEPKTEKIYLNKTIPVTTVNGLDNKN